MLIIFFLTYTATCMHWNGRDSGETMQGINYRTFPRKDGIYSSMRFFRVRLIIVGSIIY
jgi:hypothetical protein